MNNRRFLDKMFDIRSGNTNTSHLLENDTEKADYITSLIEAVKKYSKFLQKATLISGRPNAWYVFSIEDDSNVIQLLGGDTPINIKTDVVKSWKCDNKTLGIGIEVSRQVEAFYEFHNNNVETILENILYRPFVKSIEANVISGNYFDKPLFKTANTITGTQDFDGLLKLVRKLKDTYDDGCIVGNSAVISGIIDTIDKEAYLNEYLQNGTIEGIQVIGKKDAPNEVDDKFLIGFDPNKIGLLLLPELNTKKITLVGSLDYFYQIYGFVNGGDVFNSAIGLVEE